MESSRSSDPQFALRLNKLLKEKGIKNNAQFARAINKAAMVTHGWMRGRIPRLPEDWRTLCKFFDVSSDYLLLGKTDTQVIKVTIEIPIKNNDFLYSALPDTEETQDAVIASLLTSLKRVMQKKLDRK